MIRGEIMELRNKSVNYVQKDPDTAIALAAKLSQWWNEVVEFDDADDALRPSAYSSTILNVLKHELIISLHRPTVSAALKDSAYDDALQQCIGSARSIITTLHRAINVDKVNHSMKLALLWPSCTWAVWISTFILFYAAVGKHLAEDTVFK